MNLNISQKDGKTIAKVVGRIGTAEAIEFDQQMKPLLTGNNPDIEMDCSALDYISSSGLRLFFTLHKSVNERNGSLVFTNLQDTVRRVFVMTGFSKIMNIR